MPASREAQARAAVRRNVKRLMGERSWGPSQLAKASGISRRMCYYIIGGERSCTVGTLAQLAHALGVETEELLK